MAPSLLVSQAPESGQRVHLHPLVLLTASDLITRHRLRQLEGPIAGLLLGQQEGTRISAEYAFTAKLKDGLLDQTEQWTDRRIEQFKEVHQKPVLEIVGWFTLCPENGPLPEHTGLHKQLTSLYAENGIMLAIHPREFKEADSAKAKLPISIYESITEGEASAGENAMQIDSSETGLRFRPVPFTIDTDETEMIAINYVAKGAGGAGAVSQTASTTQKSEASDSKLETTGQEKTPAQPKGPVLTPEEEDQIAGLTTRLNAIKMLQERIQLMSQFATSLSPSYISDPSVALSPTSPPQDQLSQLRNIQALLTRLSLLTPTNQAESESLRQAGQAQTNDVAITSMLSLLGSEIQGLTELGRKFSTVEQQKAIRNKKPGHFGMAQSSFAMDDFNGRPGDGVLMM